MSEQIDIKRLALLARIKLTSEEEKEFQKDFGSILDYVSKLQEVDVSEIDHKEASRTTELYNVVREDEGVINEPGVHTEDLLKEAPSTENGYVKVKHILG